MMHHYDTVETGVKTQANKKKMLNNKVRRRRAEKHFLICDLLGEGLWLGTTCITHQTYVSTKVGAISRDVVERRNIFGF